MNRINKLFSIIIGFVICLAVLAVPVFATTTTVLDGKISITDSANSNTVSNGVVTINAKGSFMAKKTNTITITNETDSKATISFDYSASTYNSFTVAGASVGASGTHKATLNGGETVTVVLTSNSGFSNTTATLTLSNFSYAAAVESVDITFVYNSNCGSVTLGGTTVANGAKQTITSSNGTLIATPSSGCSFLGWVDGDSKLLSASASYTLEPVADMSSSVQAVFVNNTSDTAWFNIDNKYLTTDLTTASNLGTKIVLANNGTLPAGNYTIASGDTLLIPYDNANTLCTSAPTHDGDEGYGGFGASANAWVQPTAYRTLTMASGAHIIVNGAMSLSGMQCADAKQLGMPTKETSFVKMESGSSITVNNGANLYAWGYITGSGTITAKSGAKVYQDFVIMDWRGGSQSTNAEMKNNKVFVFSEFYFQNIEVPLTLEYGATEYGIVSVIASNVKKKLDIVLFAPSGGMFNLTSGSLTQDYEEATDRMVFDLHGDLVFDHFVIDLSILGKIDTASYYFPFGGQFRLLIREGSNITFNSDIAMIPGVEVVIEEDATAYFNSRAVIYDADQWGNYCYHNAKSASEPFVPIVYAPGRIETRNPVGKDPKILVNGTLDASNGALYTTSGGANIYSDGTGVVILNPGTETVTHQCVQGSPVTYPEISITPALLLKNSDNSIVKTANDGANTYTYTDGFWRCTTHTPGAAATCNTAQICTVCQEVLQAALGHTEVIVPAVAPTCTATGLTEGKKCSVCGTVTVAQTEVGALGHEYGEVGYEWTGYTACVASYTCVRKGCGVTETANATITNTVTTKPTCTESGVRTYIATFTENWAATQTKTETVAATGHNYTGAYKDNGNGTHSQLCLNGCNTYGEEVEHTYDQEIASEAFFKSEANCQSAAVYNNSCVCGAKGSETFEKGEKNSSKHTQEAIWAVDADGHRKYYPCCNQDIVAQAAHNYVNGECTVAGCGYKCTHEGEALTYTDNSDGTHKVTYAVCGVVQTDNAKHDYGETHECACGAVEMFTITFDTAGGSTVAPITGNYGTAVQAPEAPTKTGYTFAGWDVEVPATMPDEDVTITAQWTVNQYTITFDTDGGSAVAPITQDYNTAVTAPADPTKTGHTFDGWDVEIPATMPAENMTVTAKWTVNQYTITFNTAGGSTIDPITGNYNDGVTAPENPTREGYTFAGWDKQIPSNIPAENMTITAQWKINTYTVKWENEDGTVLETDENVEHDTVPAYNGATPTKAATAQYTYTFNGWTPEVSAVTGDMTYTATYTASLNSYTVTWKNADGTVLEQDENVPYGKTPNYDGEIPTKDKEGCTSYSFAGWDKEPASVNGDVTYTAKFEANTVHNYDQQNTDDEYLAAAATCKAKATYYYSCVCGQKGTETFEDGVLLDHSWNSVISYVPEQKTDEHGCVFYEFIASRSCINCKTTETATVETVGELRSYEGQEPTCSKEGVGSCEVTFVEDWTKPHEFQNLMLPLDPNNHENIQTVPGTAPTCTATGKTDKIYCTACNKILVEHKEIAMIDHGIKEVVYAGGNIPVKNQNIAALKASSFIQEMTVQDLVDKVNYCVNEAAKNSPLGTFANFYGSEEFQSFVQEIVGKDANDLTDTQKSNATVLYVARKLSEANAEDLRDFLATDTKYSTISQYKDMGEKIARAALTYGMYCAYESCGMEWVTVNLEKIMDCIEDSDKEGFLRYLEIQGERDLAGFLAAMETIHDAVEANGLHAMKSDAEKYMDTLLGNDSENKAVETLLEKGFSDPDLVELIQNEITDYSHYCSCDEKLTDCILETVPGKDATCTETGLTDGSICILCGTETQGEVISKKSHELSKTEAVEETCTTPGNSEYWTCKTCGKFFSDGTGSNEIAKDSWIVESSGHTLDHMEAVAATCTVDGNIEHWKCSAEGCDAMFADSEGKTSLTEEEVIVKAAHSWNDGEVTTAATCTTAGVKTYTCTVETCGVTQTEEIPIDSSNHTVTEETGWQSNETTHWQICPACNGTVNSGEHTYEDGICTGCGNKQVCEHTGGEATCQNKAVCEKCGEEYGELADHIAGEAVVENEVSSTATVVGSYEEVVYCSVEGCGQEISREKKAALLNPFTTAMTLGESLTIHFRINPTTVPGEGNYVLLTRYFANGTTETTRIEQADWVDRPGYATDTICDYSGLAAREMSEKFELVLYNAQGEVISTVREAGIRSYAMNQIAKYENDTSRKELVTLLVDMLNYGAAAQTQFTYNVEDLANNQLTQEQQDKFATKDVTADTYRNLGEGCSAISCSLENKLELNVIFYASIVENGSYAIFSYTDHNGNEQNVRVEEFAKHTANTQGERVKAILSIPAPDACKMITCTLYDKDDNVVSTAVDSVNGYLYRNAQKYANIPVYEMTLRFTVSSYNYFH